MFCLAEFQIRSVVAVPPVASHWLIDGVPTVRSQAVRLYAAPISPLRDVAGVPAHRPVGLVFHDGHV